MSLGFFQPWAWFAVVAVSAPLWLHLLRRFRTKPVPFAALKFVDEAPPPRFHPWKVRDIWLLLMRLLAVLLLVSAFAWPYFADDARHEPTETRIYLLDNTLSHQARGAFRLTRDALASEIAALGNEIQAGVIVIDAEPRVLARLSDNHATAAAAVAGSQPAAGRGSYLSAFRLAREMFQNALGERHRLFLRSDQQSNQWEDAAATVPFLEGVEVDLGLLGNGVDPVETPPVNVAVSRPKAQRTWLGEDVVVDLTFEAYHQNGPKTVTVIILANGKEVGRQDLALAADTPRLSISARFPADPAVWLLGQVRLEAEGDVLEADNRVDFALPPVTPGTVAVNARSRYIRAALAPAVMRGRWTAAFLDEHPDAAASKADSSSDVLLIEAGMLRDPAARDHLLNALKQGRGVVLLINREGPLIQGLLRSAGVELQGLRKRTPEAPGGFRHVLGSHPLFQPFRNPDFGSLQDVQFFQYRKLRSQTAVTLAFSDEGEPIIMQAMGTPGNLIILGFGLDREETNWPILPTFVPFLDLCLQAARAAPVSRIDYEPGELAVIPFPEAPTGPLSLYAENSQTPVATAEIRGKDARTLLPVIPGTYALKDNDGTVKAYLCINPSPLESILTYKSGTDIITAWSIPAETTDPGDPQATDRKNPAKADSDAGSDPTPESRVLRQNHWWWLLLAGVLFLGFENLGLLALRRRRTIAKHAIPI